MGFVGREQRSLPAMSGSGIKDYNFLHSPFPPPGRRLGAATGRIFILEDSFQCRAVALAKGIATEWAETRLRGSVERPKAAE